MKSSVIETAMLQGTPTPEIVSFRSGGLTLQGLLWRPAGQGPFPAVLYNHGSGRSYEKAFAALGPVFAQGGISALPPTAGVSACQQTKGSTSATASLARCKNTDHTSGAG